ncbi:hypothetical protein, partial [Escherichia coli]|uniref:hypothetical protein n=1 Tax=Escherichia coli TaxID=562 RepID=UPI0019533D3B
QTTSSIALALGSVQAIVSTPTTVKYYTQGRLIKCCETDSTGNITTSYTYNDKGQLTTTLLE